MMRPRRRTEGGAVALWLERYIARLEGLPLSLRRRLLALFFLVPTATVLWLALMLEPDPSGVGTHTQLGLGQCSMLLLTDWPCPMCGMTTTFSHLAHGELVAGFLNQPFGLVLFLLTVGCAVISSWELVTARGRLGGLLAWALAHDLLVATGTLAGLLGGWIYKVLWLRELLPWAG